jgi:hypothetical protein
MRCARPHVNVPYRPIWIGQVAQSLPRYSAFAGRFGGGDQRGGERFIAGKELFHPVPVAGERLGPVTAVHGAVQALVRLE